jgi:large repetitive protein
MIRSNRSVFTMLVGAVFLLVSGCNSSEKQVTSITVTPATSSLERGKTVNLTATAAWSDNTTTDVTADATWSSSNAATASVANSGTKGVVNGLAIGEVTITASFVKAGGSQIDGTAQVTVNAPPKGSVVVTPKTGLTTTEGGGVATFTVVLSSQPTANVAIAVSSSKTTEGTVSPALLTLTSTNWNAPQTVTITGVDDDLADGPQNYTIVLANAESTDVVFGGVEVDDVAVTNTDNDTAGFTVSPTNGLVTTEAGGVATFTLKLNSRPSGNVTVALSSSKPTEGIVSPASLTFTPMNWNAPQTVTVTGVNDDEADGAQTYVIVTAPAVSTDTSFDGLNPDDVGCSNTDNDSAGITVAPTAGLVTTEAAGGTATFTVVLNSRPTATVTIALSSSNVSEATVSPGSLTFTATNWNAPQTVTVTGVEDQVADGNQTYTIVTAPAVSTDTGYNGLNAADVAGSNTDNDTAGVTVTPASGLTTTESGGTATFTVRLNTQPTATVTIALSSSNANEATVSPASLTFTTANWNAPQTVTVTGVDDQIADGNQNFTIVTAPAVSTDTNYSGVNGSDVTASNTDNDSAGVSVTPTTGLTTTEAGGTATFSVRLNSQPTANVTIALSSSNTNEGTLSAAALTFTTLNWNAPQTVTVTGVNDSVADGNQTYTIVTAAAVSTDTRYSGVNAPDVAVTNTDNDSAGITVTPTTNLTTSEAGATATFTIVLNSQPTAGVSIGLSSSSTTEGTVNPNTVAFTTANWNAPQTVTITGVNDSVADGNQPYTIITAPAVSTDLAYNGVNPSDVAVSNTDNDSASITVTPTTGLTTSEVGATATFTMVLNSQPTASVTIGLSSSNGAEGTVAPTSVVFTTANWNSPRQVTVTGVNDGVIDGNQVFTIVTAAASSTDSNYNSLNPADVSVTNNDDDSAAILVSPSSVSVNESGTSSTFTVALQSQPTANVVIALSSSNSAEGTASPASLTFTALNWNAPQIVTVTGVDDVVADGAQVFSIVTAPAASTDVNYSALNGPDVSVTNVDNDSAGVTVVPNAGLSTSEGGGIALFTVVLNSQPTGNVTIGLSSSDVSEGSVAPASLTFTSANWNAPRLVTVTGADDIIQDGTQFYSIILAPATSTDLGYNGFDASDVSVSNVDNDTPGITVFPTVGLTTTEAGGQGNFQIVLNSQPTGNVTITLSSSDTGEGTVAPASVTFTTANWNAPQSVTVTGVEDAIADGNQPYQIVTAPATSADLGYAGLDAANVSVSNIDNDSAGITVSRSSGLVTTEAGGTDDFTIVLNSEPTANVVIALSSSNIAEGTVSPATLTFTPANWNAPRTVTVTGVNDAVQDGNQTYLVVTAPAVSTDTNYSGLNALDVSVSNTDNDSAGITVSAPTPSASTDEAGGGVTFTVVLNSQPTADVTVAVSSSDITEGTVSPPSLVFTGVNWNAPQTVTVTGVNDAEADGAQPFSIITAAATSTDVNYSGLPVPDVALTNLDNDSAGVVVTVIDTTTGEAGATGSYTVELTSQPTANVTIAVSSSDTSEGTVSTSTLTFTPLNWNAAQTVTVTGVDDSVQDGDQPFTAVNDAAVSTDPNYSGKVVADVVLTNVDNDTAGVTVSAGSLVSTEAGGTDTFTIVLNSEPTANVTITLSSSAVTEGTVSPTSLTFTPLNWNAPRTVTVTGVDDLVQDGNQVYTIVTSAAVSTDPNYNTLAVSDVSVSNTDNDSAGITVTPTTALTTTEAGVTDSFTVVLNSQPTASVTITLASSDTTEATVSPTSITFTTANWNSPRTVTVTGINDAVQDGNQPWTIVLDPATSTDANYSGLNPTDVTGTNTDNDTAGITVDPTSGLVTFENGAGATFTIVLNAEPTADVTIALSSSDATEGTVSPASVTFTPLNWNAPATVTIASVDDAVADGNQPFTIVTAVASSADTNFNGLNAADVSVTNNDNDSAGINVSGGAIVTTEAGGTGTFTIVLNSQPTASVTIGLSSSRVSEGTLSVASVTFTTSNWAAPQTLTVTGVNDFVADGNQPYTIVTAPATSADSNYSSIDPANVSATNNDDDSPGITVSPLSGLSTSEGGGVTIFTVVLQSQPTATVVVPLSSSDTTEGTVSPASLTFTAANWNSPQFVTVTGVDDALRDGNQPYSIVTAPATSTDPLYNGLDAADPAITNVDNDSPGIIITPTSGLQTSEGGSTATFTIVLAAVPTASVVLSLSSSDITEGTMTPGSVTFTTANWNVPQTITVSGIDDVLVDGNQPYLIVTAPAASADPGYSGLDPADVSCTNLDNEP